MKKYRKRADGRYQMQIVIGYNPDGKRKVKTIYGKTIKELEKKEREMRGKIDIGIKIADDITVGEWADIWLKTFKSNIAHNTYSRYEGIINKQIKPNIGTVPVNKVKLNVIQALINELKEIYSPATVKKIKDVMHQMFQQAIKSQYITFNPTDGVDIPQLTQKNREVIPDEHIQSIEKFCENYKHGAFVMCLLYTGMRRGEILALKVSDIDLENKVIHVNKAVEFKNNTPNIKAPKTPKSNRNIPILEVLEPYLKTAIQNKNADDVVFCKDNGAIYDKSSIQMLFRNFNKQYNEYIGNEDSPVHFTMHQFRHTFCTILYNAGVDVKMAQDLLGHSSVNVTLGIYTHLSYETKMIGADKINEYIATKSVKN